MAAVWTCQRRKAGVKCGAKNPRRKRLCQVCGGKRPARKVPAHRRVLGEMPYDEWVARFGEVCGVCGRGPTANRRLDRDHCHASGEARGLLCHRDNRALASWVTPEWLRAAADYLERAATRHDDGK